MSTAVQLAKDVFRIQSDKKMSLAASGAAFWLMLGLFPAGVASVNILGLVFDQEKIAAYLGEFAANGPGTIGALLAEQLQKVAQPSPGTWAVDTFLVFVSLWTVSTAVGQVLAAIRSANDMPHRSFVHRRVRNLGLGALIVTGLPFAIYILASMGHLGLVYFRVALFVFVVAGLLGIYLTAVGWRTPPVRQIPGVVLVTVFIIAMWIGFSLIIKRSSTYDAIYGTLAGVVITMVAIWIVTYAVIIGAIVNVQLGRTRR